MFENENNLFGGEGLDLGNDMGAGFDGFTPFDSGEAESIFADVGLEPDEYYIDDYLNDVVLVNPIPETTHRECLQLLANACRCIIRQDENGRIMIKANFATVLDPEDLQVATNGVSDWSKPENIFVGTSVIYADMTQEFLKADGNMYFLASYSSI